MEVSYIRRRDDGELGPVRVSFNEEDIARARHLAARKVNLVDIHSPGGDRRSHDVRLRRLVAGKLADHAVAQLLTLYYARNAPLFWVQEYDDVRTDQFKQPDPWDLRCIDPKGNSRMVEVRSSFVHRLNNAERLWTHPRQSLLGPYRTAAKSMEAAKDLFWQVAFLRVPVDEGDRGFNLPFQGDARDLPLDAYVMGGGESELFDRIGTYET